MPTPATPTRWMRRILPGSTSDTTRPSSGCVTRPCPGSSAGSREAECLRHRVVEARPERADPRVVPPGGGAVGAEGDYDLAAQVDPQAGAGEAEMAHGAGRRLAEPAAGRGLGPRVARPAGVEAEGPRPAGRPGIPLERAGPERGRRQPGPPADLLQHRLAEGGDVAGGAEQPGMAGHAVHRPRVVVVDLARARGPSLERGP